jgi:hypothetical protein
MSEKLPQEVMKALLTDLIRFVLFYLEATLFLVALPSQASLALKTNGLFSAW